MFLSRCFNRFVTIAGHDGGRNLAPQPSSDGLTPKRRKWQGELILEAGNQPSLRAAHCRLNPELAGK
jgi:hypothetical protein